MNVQGIVLFCILFGASVTLVNGLGMFATALANPNAPGAVALQSASGTCSQWTSAGICLQTNTNVGGPNSIASPIYTFGFFLWSFVQAVPLMVQGALVPGSVASIYFGGVGAVVNVGMLFLLSLWAWYVVGNRPQPVE